jgi:hypothetical protein
MSTKKRRGVGLTKIACRVESRTFVAGLALGVLPLLLRLDGTKVVLLLVPGVQHWLAPINGGSAVVGLERLLSVGRLRTALG